MPKSITFFFSRQISLVGSMILPFISAVTDGVTTRVQSINHGRRACTACTRRTKKKKNCTHFLRLSPRSSPTSSPSMGTIATREGHLIYSFRPWSSGFSVFTTTARISIPANRTSERPQRSENPITLPVYRFPILKKFLPFFRRRSNTHPDRLGEGDSIRENCIN